ncbi:alanine/glycine:cation symporter family protein [Mailhella massiliensis]|uniref:alanine/glycine:cation symporter family protein n=1 Tax=Mailhella massiliensis TaxID=1903261 RepID=UPI00097D63AF|nr:sodium:alanine symporter family protein [Mailhella massiliensis]
MEWLTLINNFVWGPCMLVLLFGTGLYLTIGLRFFTIRNFARGLHHAWAGRRQDSEHGEISPFNALMTALAGDIGTGNIVGVATAIYMGGPGALFWMWMTALVGMATKFSEVLLAVHFRERTPAGNWVGGAMFFIKNGLGRRWMWLGSAFALFGIVACIGTGAMVQSNAIGGVLKASFGIPFEVSAVVLLLLSGLVLLGGVKRIAAVAGKIVPVMALCYAAMALLVIVMHISEVPGIFAMVLREAFTPTAAQGGAAGASIMMAIRMGMARGIFSNEAGLGTAPMAHAAASTRSPMTQATIGMLDTFIDTIVVCSLTAFALLVTGLWSNGQEGAAVTSAAFESVLPGVGGIVVTVCLSLFAFTTAMSWCVYGERCAIYFFGDRAQLPFRVVYCIAIPVGILIKLDLVWLLADTCNALMAIPNLIAILLLSPVLFKLVKQEEASFRSECAKDD